MSKNNCDNTYGEYLKQRCYHCKHYDDACKLCDIIGILCRHNAPSMQIDCSQGHFWSAPEDGWKIILEE